MARGGSRPGAGRPKGVKTLKDDRESIPADIRSAARSAKLSPLDYMLAVMNDDAADDARRDRMAQAAAPFVHARAGEGGKKEGAADKAKAATQGRFAPKAPPKLVVSNG